MTPPQTTRDALLKRKAEIDAKLKRLDAIERNQKRKHDTRKKIIVGAIVLEHAKTHEAFAKNLDTLLKQHVLRSQDRALLDLPPLPENQQGENST